MNKSFIFFGSPRFATIILEDLFEKGFVPAAIVCNVDKPVGRKKILTPPPSKVFAQKHLIPFFQFENCKDPMVVETLPRADFAVVAAYAHIIPDSVLSLFPSGVVGVHPSLLPLYRGSSPIQSVLLDGLLETGVSLYIMDSKMDHGPVIVQKNVDIDDADMYENLEGKLAHCGASLLINVFEKDLAQTASALEQNHEKATFTRKFITADGYIEDIYKNPEHTYNVIRALTPDPGAYTFIHEKRVKLLCVKKINDEIVITKILPEGKREQMSHIVVKK